MSPQPRSAATGIGHRRRIVAVVVALSVVASVVPASDRMAGATEDAATLTATGDVALPPPVPIYEPDPLPVVDRDDGKGGVVAGRATVELRVDEITEVPGLQVSVLVDATDEERLNQESDAERDDPTDIPAGDDTVGGEGEDPVAGGQDDGIADDTDPVDDADPPVEEPPATDDESPPADTQPGDEAGSPENTEPVIGEEKPPIDPQADDELAVIVDVLPADAAAEISLIGLAFSVDFVEGAASVRPFADEVDGGQGRTGSVLIDYSDVPLGFGASFEERMVVVYRFGCAQLGGVVTCLEAEALETTIDLSTKTITAPLVDHDEMVARAIERRLRHALDRDALEELFSPAGAAGLLGAPRRLLLAWLAGGAGGGYYGLGSSPTGPSGDFRSVPVPEGSSWGVDAWTGSSQLSYDIPVPPSSAGPVPQVSLSYSSGAVDEMAASRNNQPSILGVGWALSGGAITANYKPCPVGVSPGMMGDYCLKLWSGDTWPPVEMTISLNGRSSRLVETGTAGVFRLESDPMWLVYRERGSVDPSKNDFQQEHWRVESPDGVTYYFGEDPDGTQKSLFWAWVYHNDNAPYCSPNDPPNAVCRKGWQWNLDRIVDANGNTVRYFYDVEMGYYITREYHAQDFTAPYVRAGNVSKIEYTTNPSASVTQPHARVEFVTASRCVDEATACTPGNGSHWPDVPWDLDCDDGQNLCQHPQHEAPTFWSTRRLAEIRVLVYDNGNWRHHDRVRLTHQFPTPPADAVGGDSSEPKMWLASIQRIDPTGQLNNLPEVTFSQEWWPNRTVDAAGVSAMMAPRVKVMTNEWKGTVTWSYGQSHACLTSPTAVRRMCDNFPAWVPSGSSGSYELFNRWKVTSVALAHPSSTGPAAVTQYQYPEAPRWRCRYEIHSPGSCVWAEYRGHRRVVEVHPDSSSTEYRFFTGMDKDRATATGAWTDAASVTLSTGALRPDHDWLAGRIAEVRRFDSQGQWLTREIYDYASTGTVTGSFVPGEKAYWSDVSLVESSSRVVGGSTRTSRVDYVHDSFGQVVQVVERRDTATSDDDMITKITYATPTGSQYLRDRPVTVESWEGLTVGASGDRIAHTRAFYDGRSDTQVVAGNPTIVDMYRSATEYLRTTYVYDNRGRPTAVTDPAGSETRFTYTSGSGRIESVTTAFGTTDALTESFEYPFTLSGTGIDKRHLVITDPGGNQSRIVSDSLGRPIQLILPDPTTGQAPDTGPVHEQVVYGHPSGAPTYVQHTVALAGAQQVTTVSYHDGFARPVQTQVNDPDSSGRILTTTAHDVMGRPKNTAAPYTASGTAGSGFVAPTWSSITRYDEQSYDALGRSTAVTAKSGSSTLWSTLTQHGVAGDPWVTSQVDAEGAATTFAATATGDVAWVLDALEGAVDYSYDRFGRMLESVGPESLGQWLTLTSTGDQASTPDHSTLDLVGDLTLVAYTPTPSTDATLLSKWDSGDRSYKLSVANGRATVAWSTDGTNGFSLTSDTAIPAYAYGVGAALDVVDGAGHSARFYWFNGARWHPLGNKITGASTTSVHAGSAPVRVGRSGDPQDPALVGGVHSVEVWQGLRDLPASSGGTRVANPRFDVISEWPNLESAVDAHGREWSLSGTAAIAPGVAPPQGLLVSGATGSRAWTGHHSDLNVEDHTLVFRADLAWGSANGSIMNRITANDAASSYGVDVNKTHLVWRVAQKNGDILSFAHPHALIGHRDVWFAAQFDATNRQWKIFRSYNGDAWTQVASSSTGTAIEVRQGTLALGVGGRGDGGAPTGVASYLEGSIYRAQVWSGIRDLKAKTGGTLRAGARFDDPDQWGRLDPGWDQAGRKWAVGGDAEITRHPRPTSQTLVLDGSGWVEAAHTPAMAITGDLTLVARGTFNTPPSTIEALVGKWTSGQRAYRLDRLTNSHLRIAWSTTGSNALTASSTAPIPAGSVGVAVTLDVNNGSGGRAIKFWTTLNGVTWTQLGSTVTQSGITFVYGGTQPLYVGRSSSGSSESFVGTLDSVEVWHGIRNLSAGTGGSLRANPRFSEPGEWTDSKLGVDRTAVRWTLQGTATVNRPGVGSDAQTTTMTYDLAGRMLSSTDPGRGTTTYGYDGGGRVTRRTDARGIAVHYLRDAQGRVVEERLASTSGTVVASYTYATTGPSKGLLVSTASFDDVGDPVSSESYTYDRRGRMLTRTITVGSESYQFAYGYDAGGLVSVSYPDFGAGVETLTMGFDALGRPVSMVSSLGEDLVTDTTYLPDGSLTAVTLLADGLVPVTRQWHYDTATRRLVGLTAGTTGLGSTNLQNLGFTHDLNGNIASLVDTHNAAQWQCFTYDPSQRLTAAFTTGTGACATADTGVGAGGFDTGWVLDGAGRVRSRTDAGDTTVFGFDGHRVTSTSTTSGTETHTYDAAGYMTGSGTASLGWDGRGRLVSWSDATTSATFGYDHSGERVARTIDSDTTVFVAGIEITDTHTVVPYTFAGHTVATRTYTTTSNQIELVLGDHLGSPHTIIDDTGTVTGRRLHEPYGQVRHETGGLPGSTGFTGQTTDPTGLVYYGARYYSPAMHAFISADPIVPNPYATSDWNRYAYVAGNPTNYTDPTGHCRWLPFAPANSPCFPDFGGWLLDFGRGAVMMPVEAARGAVDIARDPKAFGEHLMTSCREGASGCAQNVIFDFVVGPVRDSIKACVSGSGYECGQIAAEIAVTVLGASRAAATKARVKSVTDDGARFVADATGNVTLRARGAHGWIDVQPHAAMRMTQRGISMDTVEQALARSPFRYWHDNTWKRGYYDPTTNVFVGTVNGSIVTVVRPSAGYRYIANLLRERR